MKDTINKDKRRIQSIHDQNNYYEAWNVSYKYSSYLIKKINHKDIHILCYNIYNQYMNELKNKKINNKNQSKKYIQIWNTMINTLFKQNIKKSINLLHLTNLKNKN